MLKSLLAGAVGALAYNLIEAVAGPWGLIGGYIVLGLILAGVIIKLWIDDLGVRR